MTFSAPKRLFSQGRRLARPASATPAVVSIAEAARRRALREADARAETNRVSAARGAVGARALAGGVRTTEDSRGTPCSRRSYHAYEPQHIPNHRGKETPHLGY